MKKLKLDLENLKVESFETVNEKDKKKGTVYGNLPQTEPYTLCRTATCLTDGCGCSVGGQTCIC